MGEEGGVDGPLFSALWLRSDVCASWPLRRAMGGGARAWAGLRVGRRVGRGWGGGREEWTMDRSGGRKHLGPLSCALRLRSDLRASWPLRRAMGGGT